MAEGDTDEFKRVLLEGNPFFLGLTFCVSMLHSVSPWHLQSAHALRGRRLYCGTYRLGCFPCVLQALDVAHSKCMELAISDVN